MPQTIEAGNLISRELEAVVEEYNHATRKLNKQIALEVKRNIEFLQNHVIKNRERMGDSNYYVLIDNLGCIQALTEGRTDWEP